MAKAGGIEIRPMTPEDVDEAQTMAAYAIADTVDSAEEREKIIGRPIEERARVSARYFHLLDTDGPGSWVADDGRIVGVSVSLRRDGLWALSLLAVDGEYRGTGIGKELLGRALDYGSDCRARMTVSSTHPAAIRSYARNGMQLRPTIWARGVPQVDGEAEDYNVRVGTKDDADLTAEVDLAVRGAAHGSDIDLMLDNGANLLVINRPGERGYVLEREGSPLLLAATGERAAADLLRACLSRASGKEADVPWISADQNWAVPVVLDAGMALQPAGCVCVKGETGPLTPYLPNGAFL
jgi:GNAT superfamily N-acetyltransferase